MASALRIGLLCNDAKVERQNGSEIVLEDPTEAALIVAAEKAFINRETLVGEYPRISEIPFDETVAFAKGAPSTMIETVGVCLLLQIAAVSTPLLQKVLRTVPPTISEWGVIATCSLAPLVVIEFVKLIQRWAVNRQSHVERIMPEQIRT